MGEAKDNVHYETWAGHIGSHRRDGIDVAKLVRVVASSGSQNVSKWWRLGLTVWIVTEATGNSQFLGCVLDDFGVDLLQVIGVWSLDKYVVGVDAIGNTARNLRDE